MIIHIHIEEQESFSQHTWKPNVALDDLIQWWHSLTDEEIQSIRLKVKSLGNVTKFRENEPDPKWCLFLSEDEAHLVLGDKYFVKTTTDHEN